MIGYSHGYRARALESIARLTAKSPNSKRQHSFGSLYNGLSRNVVNGEERRLSGTPMGIQEVEVLFALCKAAPLLDDYEKACQLLGQLSPYLLEAQTQDFAPSPFLKRIEPSPWEALTYQLTKAILSLGLRHDDLHDTVQEYNITYLKNCLRLVRRPASPQSNQSQITAEDSQDVATVTLSLLGFLKAASAHADFFNVDEMVDMIRSLRDILDENFMISVEGAFSSIRTSDESQHQLAEWKIYTKRYAASGQPLGAMLLQRDFIRLLVSCSSLQTCSTEEMHKTDVFEVLISNESSISKGSHDASNALIELMTELAVESMRLLEDGSDYLKLGSAWQQHLAFSVKAYSLHTFLNCMILDEDIADIDILMSWLESAMGDRTSMADETLASVVLKSLPVIARFSPAIASSLSRSLPRFIVQSCMKGESVALAARSLTYILRLLSLDAVITGLYSLANVLSAGSGTDRTARGADIPNGIPKNPKVVTLQNQLSTHHSTTSAISLDMSGEEETSAAYSSIVCAVVTIATNCKDAKIAALAQSMLLQKLGRISLALDLHIIRETAELALASEETEFKSLLKLYDRLCHEAVKDKNATLLGAVYSPFPTTSILADNMDQVRNARTHIARRLTSDSPLFTIYLISLLETVVSKGDVHEGENNHKADVDLAAREIVELVPSLATLVSIKASKDSIGQDDNIARLYREAWFNIIVHGITPSSTYGRRCLDDLRVLALHSKALVAEERSDQFESEIELNTILRRGMNPSHTTEQKKRLIHLLPRCEADIRGLSYPRVIFLLATYLVETLRAEAGNCTHILTYFLDPSLNGSAMENCMGTIADEVMTLYLQRTFAESYEVNSAPLVAEQLASMFIGCCHRIPRVQQIAVSSAEKLVSQIPSALCQRSSLFALLELLSIMWTSCLEAELDEYELKNSYSSARGKVSVELSDDYELRRNTLNNFYKRAKTWVSLAIDLAPLNVKGLLQTYLAEYEDDGAYGHVALGRSFAADMGSNIPTSDKKLGAIEHHDDITINTTSDFIAQYTTRQEYKHADPLPCCSQEWVTFRHMNGSAGHPIEESQQELGDEETLLARLEQQAHKGKYIPIGELRDKLRRAAALLCRTDDGQFEIVDQLVNIPFAIFNKQSIKLGISLWLGIINENPRMEPRILTLIAEGWKVSIMNRKGVFSAKLQHPDPFYTKEEFAPSDKGVLLKQQQTAQDLIAPHIRVLHFLISHFNANRLGSPHSQRMFHSLILVTLRELKHCTGHPLAREFYFQVVHFALNILRYSMGSSQTAQWRLKDSILSAGLSWFSHQPRWSFGGNRLQVKAEIRLMADVEAALRSVSALFVQAFGCLQSLANKQELLLALLENERMRLTVWLYPLDHERRHLIPFSNSGKGPSDDSLSNLLKAAWAESANLAVQLTRRFASATLADEVRGLLLRYPERAIDEPDAVQILLGASLPPDISFQLKYLLYWAPVNPITAVTYFLPEYRNHPFIIQYAMRALESHSVDVTFFYVPQIVQTLRYDALGYVQRYILETAKFSQLFAHQIIWNMTANAFKDEDSTIEDPLKPTLDVVKERMIASFSSTDNAFYQREFSFFSEITDISGKLRPFIKKSKPEKKQKIEEELRKIKVDVGVYLPSNPDGVVIGIDRKSGKPLQSHAKAPYMATFRIKKNRGGLGTTDDMLEKANQNKEGVRGGPITEEETYEVWQSAIFKVGDDCRQDMLALQMIAAFRGIFNDIGLDVFVYPYRVTATAPGCGVIDVLPNSISRDMLGREAVNGLYDYFVSKYGTENSIRFQEARSNFVKSMAAYSVISYLLQFKDRHNGNIMVDDAGHILHIDFGFCFDIAPGGVRFERAPFKLTSEMVAVMGGSTSSQSYRWFEELCIKAFLASRPHTEKLCHIVVLMLGSGLPCFKPETILHLRQRFVLEKSEREAADFMRDLIKKSYSSYSTKGYDQFQLLTNGIPY